MLVVLKQSLHQAALPCSEASCSSPGPPPIPPQRMRCLAGRVDLHTLITTSVPSLISQNHRLHTPNISDWLLPIPFHPLAFAHAVLPAHFTFPHLSLKAQLKCSHFSEATPRAPFLRQSEVFSPLGSHNSLLQNGSSLLTWLIWNELGHVPLAGTQEKYVG